MAKLNKEMATVVIVKAKAIVNEWDGKNDGEKMDRLTEEFEKASNELIFASAICDLGVLEMGDLINPMDLETIGEDMYAFAKELGESTTLSKAILITELFKVFMYKEGANPQYLYDNEKAYAELLNINVDRTMEKIIISGIEALENELQ